MIYKLQLEYYKDKLQGCEVMVLLEPKYILIPEKTITTEKVVRVIPGKLEKID